MGISDRTKRTDVVQIFFLKNIQKEFSHRSARLESTAYRNKVHGLAVFGAEPG